MYLLKNTRKMNLVNYSHLRSHLCQKEDKAPLSLSRIRLEMHYLLYCAIFTPWIYVKHNFYYLRWHCNVVGGLLTIHNYFCELFLVDDDGEGIVRLNIPKICSHVCSCTCFYLFFFYFYFLSCILWRSWLNAVSLNI